jgi:hypothetical protein
MTATSSPSAGSTTTSFTGWAGSPSTAATRPTYWKRLASSTNTGKRFMQTNLDAVTKEAQKIRSGARMYITSPKTMMISDADPERILHMVKEMTEEILSLRAEVATLRDKVGEPPA